VEPVLAHGTPAAIVAALARQPRDALVALVGHEPTLGSLLARLVEGESGDRFAFKKGGAALVDLPAGPRAPGRLVWFVKPRILRTLDPD
jgi:phosphohistidine phosphatase SixA